MTLPVIFSRVAGVPVLSAAAERTEVFNPATGEAIALVEHADSALCEAALDSARAAQMEWAARTGAERAVALRRIADLMRANADELAELETRDTGKPITEARTFDVPGAIDPFDFFAGAAMAVGGEHHVFGANYAYTRREPLGVCSGIGAWNYPLQIAAYKLAPALAAGNAMLYKPSELTPLSTVRLAELLDEAGLPAGLCNILQGGAKVGTWLSSAPGIAKVSLTGSVATGHRVLAAAVDTMKSVTLELGGKSPLIIFADADLDAAIQTALAANFVSQGEVCTNATRVYVERPIYDAFRAKLVEKTEAIVVGDPRLPETRMGALISEAHFDKVLGHIAGAVQAGARLLTGGGRAKVAGLDNGWFVAPAILEDCAEDGALATQEVFGPVVSLFPFDDEDDVIARANSTSFGLAGGVMTRDLARAHRVSAALECGICWINGWGGGGQQLPYGGRKLSGLGVEASFAALHSYTQLKTIFVETGRFDAGY